MSGKVLVVCGPTASGKTALAVQCAKRLQTEIISADSMLVYQDLNIGTAKPDEAEMDGVKHHMIDVVSPFDSFSVSDYEKAALPILEDLLSRGKTPVVCGGTGFYVNALLYKSQFGNVGANAEIREKYERIYKEQGGKYLHELLQKVDLESANKLHENDVKRVIRALEIYELTGKPKSMQQDKQIPRFDFVAVSIAHDRQTLYERINRRVDEMFERGLLQEVQGLIFRGVLKTSQCMQGIGYKEIVEGLETGNSIDEIKELIKKNTRNYAKRQETFFKRMDNRICLNPRDIMIDEVLKIL